MYSSAFRSLQDKTQVVPAIDPRLFHTRLSHSLKVADIAQSIGGIVAAMSGGEGPDLDMLRAAGMAHDIGHPPFAHIAEDELDGLVRDLTSGMLAFEGNAQSLRIVSELCIKSGFDERPNWATKPERGLNLTRASLDAIAKYPWVFDGRDDRKNQKWNFYDAELFQWLRDADGVPSTRRERPSFEAQIMDWADDITFACHDLQDFWKSGAIPMHEILGWKPDKAQKPQPTAEAERLAEAIYTDVEKRLRYAVEDHTLVVTKQDVLDDMERLNNVAVRTTRYDGSASARAMIHRFGNGLIDYFLDRLSFELDVEAWRSIQAALENSEDENDRELAKRQTPPPVWHFANLLEASDADERIRVVRFMCVLKAIVFHYVVYGAPLQAAQFGQRRLVRDTMLAVLANSKLLPAYLQEQEDRDAEQIEKRLERYVREYVNAGPNKGRKFDPAVHRFLRSVSDGSFAIFLNQLQHKFDERARRAFKDVQATAQVIERRDAEFEEKLVSERQFIAEAARQAAAVRVAADFISSLPENALRSLGDQLALGDMPVQVEYCFL